MCVCYWFASLKISILAACMHAYSASQLFSCMFLKKNYSHAYLVQIAYSMLNIPNNYYEVFRAESCGAEQKPKNINAFMPKSATQ